MSDNGENNGGSVLLCERFAAIVRTHLSPPSEESPKIITDIPNDHFSPVMKHFYADESVLLVDKCSLLPEGMRAH